LLELGLGDDAGAGHNPDHELRLRKGSLYFPRSREYRVLRMKTGLVVTMFVVVGLRGHVAAEPRPIVARSMCIISDRWVNLVAAIPATETTGARTTTLWSISCDRFTNSCSGAYFRGLDAIEHGQPIGPFALGEVTNAELTLVLRSMAVVRWGRHAFTIDFDARKVLYSESAESGGRPSSRGEASCAFNQAAGHQGTSAVRTRPKIR
jgi:hypothetical protein